MKQIVKSNTMLVKYLSAPRLNTLEKLWNTDEATLQKMINDVGIDTLNSSLYNEITLMCKIINADVEKIHIEYIMDYILENYSYLTLSDLKIFSKRMVEQKPYGRPILQNIISSLKEYDLIRDEYAVMYQIKQKQVHDDIKVDQDVENEKMRVIYKRMEKDTHEPKQTQKERDAENRKAHEEKLKEFYKQYPQTDK